MQQHLHPCVVQHGFRAGRVGGKAHVQPVIQAAEGQPRHAGSGRDLGCVQQAAGGFKDGDDGQARLRHVPDLRQAFGLGQQDPGHAGVAPAGFQVVVVPGRGRVVDAHPQARLAMRPQEVTQRFAGRRLGQMLDGVFQVDDDGVRAGGQRFGTALGARSRHAQGASNDGMRHTTSEAWNCAT